MKRFIIVMIFFSVILSASFSENDSNSKTNSKNEPKNNEIYFTFGTPSFIGLMAGAFKAISDELEEKKDSSANCFTITSGYNHFLGKHLGLGGFVSYEKFATLNLMTVQAKTTLQYGFKHVKLYHSLSAGVLSALGYGSTLAFDIAYLGLKLDFSQFNLFAEACCPTTAILKVGASYKF